MKLIFVVYVWHCSHALELQLPILVYLAWKKADTIKRRALLLAALGLLLFIPTRRTEWLRKLPIWDKWFQYFSIQVRGNSLPKSQAIYAFTPHGIIPFGLALATLGKLNDVFDNLRPVVASATKMMPIFGHFIKMLGAVDASAESVDKALAKGLSLGINPGGIAEMFWTYPRAGTKPDEEYALVNGRKGFIRLAIKHGVAVVPVFVFGSSKVLKRIDLPIVETISRWLKASLILFWGRWGLPIPLPVNLWYAVGDAIETVKCDSPSPQEVDRIHELFVEQLQKLFDRYKDEYGWAHKTLRMV